MNTNLFNIGDKVEVVNYGSMAYVIACSGVDGYWYDYMPWLIGKTGVVYSVKECQGCWIYGVDGIPEKCAWYDEEQLKLII